MPDRQPDRGVACHPLIHDDDPHRRLPWQNEIVLATQAHIAHQLLQLRNTGGGTRRHGLAVRRKRAHATENHGHGALTREKVGNHRRIAGNTDTVRGYPLPLARHPGVELGRLDALPALLSSDVDGRGLQRRMAEQLLDDV